MQLLVKINAIFFNFLVQQKPALLIAINALYWVIDF